MIPSIHTPRLELRPLSAEHFAALERGNRDALRRLGLDVEEDWPDPDDLWVKLYEHRLGRNPEKAQWLMRAIVLEGSMIGHCGFHLPPDEHRSVEIAYTVAPGYRGRGYATEAAGALVDWALGHDDVAQVRASTSPDNLASLGVLARLGGWVLEAIVEDEVDGTELAFVRTR